MSYERNDRSYGAPRGDYGRSSYGRGDYGRSDHGRGDYGRGDFYGRGGYGADRGGRGPDRDDRRPADYDYDERGFFARAGDEVRSWFGDEEAERRRRYDERYDDRYDRDRDYYGERTVGNGYRDQDRGRSAGRSRDEVIGYGWTGDRAARRDRHHDGHDHDYRSWRDRQMEAYDRDYADYRRENQSRFDSEFTTYRGRRETQRGLLAQVQEHQEVVGSDGQHVGTVDHVKGDRLKLTKTDPSAGGHHHTIPSSWIESIDDGKVKIAKTADQAKAAWREEADGGDDRGGLFGGKRDDDRTSTDWRTGGNLNRSFSGTY